MAKRKRPDVPTMHGPAIYRICVLGSFDSGWSDRIGGMQVTEVRKEAGQVESVLVGRLADQAALAGVMNELYELHLPVLSAECLEAEDDSQ
jgi:hypothetical protein